MYVAVHQLVRGATVSMSDLMLVCLSLLLHVERYVARLGACTWLC